MNADNRVRVRTSKKGVFQELEAYDSAVHIELASPDMLLVHITPEGSLNRVKLSVQARRRHLIVRIETE